MRVITGSAKGVRLLTPEGMNTRPTSDRVKEGLFSIIQFEVEGRNVLDLFAGTGQLGIEALSRGAESAVFVDYSPQAVKLVKENIRRAKLQDQASVFQADYESFLRSCRQKFDIIFLDPPYAEKILENALKIISEIDILRDGGIIICEKTAEKAFEDAFEGLVRQKEYRYGNTSLVLFRKGTAT